MNYLICINNLNKLNEDQYNLLFKHLGKYAPSSPDMSYDVSLWFHPGKSTQFLRHYCAYEDDQDTANIVVDALELLKDTGHG